MNPGRHISRFLAVSAASALVLAGCASNPSAPVEDRSFGTNPGGAAPAHELTPPATGGAGSSYQVVRGDTLYAIAFKHGVDFRDLAAWNGIAPPYRIFPGQDLRLSGSAGVDRASTAPLTRPVTDHAVVASAGTPQAVPQNTQVEKSAKPAPTAFENVESEAPAVEAAPVATPVTAAPKASVAPTPPVTPAPAVATAPKPAPVVVDAAPKPAENAPQLNAGGVNWRWPGNGKVVGTYVGGDQTRQGIDIAGNAGDPVQAAADGEVVYSGNGLLGYGELIIVKHNASFLSAYGHNRKRLVQEGDKVRAGQQIAEMGSSASSREELHFEIRKNGKPVNPLDYLPVH
jgi:lipoprotein NlpD